MSGAGGAVKFLTLVVFPAEDLQPGKTGDHDHSVMFDLPQHRDFCAALLGWIRGRSPMDSLFGLDYENYLYIFKQAAVRAGVACLRPCLYGLRHGGPSHDFSSGQRDLPTIQRRGNWRSFASFRRYEKSGRIGLELQKLSEELHRHLGSAPTSWLCHGEAAPPLP